MPPVSRPPISNLEINEVNIKSEAECVALSEQARAAIKSGNVDALRNMYAADAEFYLYFLDNSKREWSAIASILGAITETASSIDFRDVKVTRTDTGLIQQHTLVVTKKTGGEGVMHAALIFTMNEAGKFTRLEEYGDISGIM